MRHPDGDWAGHSYEWNAAQSDATLVTGGKVVDVGDRDWLFPDSGQCKSCHTDAAGFSLGLELAQLNGDLTYVTTGRTVNQLRTLNAIGAFASPIGEPSTLFAFPDPYAAEGTLDERARAYLHTNCAQCHRPDGPTSVEIDLRLATPLGGRGVCGVPPQRGDLGIAGAALVAPGSPDQSVLLERLRRGGDAAAMPPLATFLPDAEGEALIRAWIASLPGC